MLIDPLEEIWVGRIRANAAYSHGAQGILDGASKGALENEFGTSNDDECMVKILEMGEYQATTVSWILFWSS